MTYGNEDRLVVSTREVLATIETDRCDAAPGPLR